MTLNDLNSLSKEEAGSQLLNCCGSLKWKENILSALPFLDEVDLIQHVHETWYNVCNEADWLEAFTHHPKIGDVKSMSEKFASTKHLTGAEQEGVSHSDMGTINELTKANREYEAKFGFIFIVCATGKSASEMLRMLNDRLHNNFKEELLTAMGEQAKITVLRLQKLLNKSDWSKLCASQLTTHVLDTSIGRPGHDITIKLKRMNTGMWQTFAQGVTNTDGRIGDMLPAGKYMEKGNYKIVFDTGYYFTTQNIKGFYPEVEIQFSVFDDTHYHVPLLVNPFGYSTYRGS